MKGYKKAEVLEAISNSGGVMSAVQSRLGCKSWRTAREYVNKWKETRDAWESENERANDLAESVIIADIQNNNVQTAKWWLERRRRKIYCVNAYAQNLPQEETDGAGELKIEIVDNDD